MIFILLCLLNAYLDIFNTIYLSHTNRLSVKMSKHTTSLCIITLKPLTIKNDLCYTRILMILQSQTHLSILQRPALFSHA